LCSVSFTRDRKRPVRVDNEAKGLPGRASPYARLVIVAHADSADKPGDVSAGASFSEEGTTVVNERLSNARLRPRKKAAKYGGID
jgi:hypothetical protein